MRQPKHQNLLVRAVAAIVAVVLTAFAIFIGALAFLGFLGLAIIAFVAFQLRLWWIRRRVAKNGRRRRRHDATGNGDGKKPTARRSGRLIEGEFQRHSDDRTD